MEWISKPTYNRVYVSGEGQGVLPEAGLRSFTGDHKSDLHHYCR